MLAADSQNFCKRGVDVLLEFSDRQWDVLEAPLHRLNILEGSVRSGKTFISLFMWSDFVASMPAGGEYIMIGKTLTSLKRNVLELLVKIVGAANFTYSVSQKEGRLWGRKIYLEGANDERSEGKIRGMTLTGAYCDELTLWPESFFAMLLSRLSAFGAKLIGTTNPDNPRHWLYTEYFDRPEVKVFNPHFTLDDNPFLDPAYVDALKNEYVGVFYKRFILGLRVAAGGIIYDMYDEARHLYDELPLDLEHRIYRRYIAIDYGTTNPCVFLEIIDDCQGNYYIERERYYDSKDKNTMRQKDDAEHADDLVSFTRTDNLRNIIIDPSAASFKVAIHKKGLRTVDADNDVNDGIILVGTLLAQGRLHINRRCVQTRKEFVSYIWNDKRTEKGVEEPFKQSDHAMDALRYFCKTIVGGYRSAKGRS
jgi:PBSX family phage terminase large subunit